MSKTRQSVLFDPRHSPDAPVSTLSYTYANGHSVPPHFHEVDQVLYGISGVMAVTTSEGLWIVPPNRAVWIPARTPHSLEIWGALTMKTLYLRPKLVKRLGSRCCLLNISPLFRELLLEACKTRSLKRSVPAQVRLIGVILDQIEAAPFVPLQVQLPRDDRALRVARLLLANPADGRRLQDVCRQCGASKRTVERLFWQETGVSFGRWRRQLGLALAVRLLAQGNKMASVALEIGYSSPSAFIASFKKVFGATPSKYLSG
jgi:AraC-like DNA-binding protein/quercetin dioxygenase-like cupin family protein